MRKLKSTSHLIEKENIPNFSFPENDVLIDSFAKSLRFKNILKGMKLGNKFKNKVQIFFEDKDSLKSVETTIWGFTDKNLILKQNTLIPIHRIYSIAL